MKPTHRTPLTENPGAGGRGAMRRAHQPAGMALTKTQLADRVAELEAALGSLWDVAVTVQHDGKRGCFVAEPEWRKAMSAHPELRK